MNTKEQLAIAMDTKLDTNFEHLFGVTCAETFAESAKANDSYHYLCGFLLGIWFTPNANRTEWSTKVLSTIGSQQQEFMRYAKVAAEIVSSDNFRNSLYEAAEKNRENFSHSLINILAHDFMHFMQVKSLPSWDSKFHAKAVAHFLALALMLWAYHPAVATAYSFRIGSERQNQEWHPY